VATDPGPEERSPPIVSISPPAGQPGQGTQYRHGTSTQAMAQQQSLPVAVQMEFRSPLQNSPQSVPNGWQSFTDPNPCSGAAEPQTEHIHANAGRASSLPAASLLSASGPLAEVTAGSKSAMSASDDVKPELRLSTATLQEAEESKSLPECASAEASTATRPGDPTMEANTVTLRLEIAPTAQADTAAGAPGNHHPLQPLSQSASILPTSTELSAGSPAQSATRSRPMEADSNSHVSIPLAEIDSEDSDSPSNLDESKGRTSSASIARLRQEIAAERSVLLGRIAALEAAMASMGGSLPATMADIEQTSEEVDINLNILSQPRATTAKIEQPSEADSAVEGERISKDASLSTGADKDASAPPSKREVKQVRVSAGAKYRTLPSWPSRVSSVPASSTTQARSIEATAPRPDVSVVDVTVTPLDIQLAEVSTSESAVTPAQDGPKAIDTIKPGHFKMIQAAAEQDQSAESVVPLTCDSAAVSPLSESR
jgi:hypothetical protein